MQCPSLDTLPPLSDPTETRLSPARFQTPAPQASPGLRGFLFGPVGAASAATCRQISSQPIARLQPLRQRRLRAARLRLVAVFEAHPRRQAHQDALGAAAG